MKIQWSSEASVKPTMYSVSDRSGYCIVFQILHGCEATSDANPGIVADDLLRYDHVQNERR